MKQWTVNVDGDNYDVDAPDEATAWAWANEFHAKRPVARFRDNVKIALASAGEAADVAFTLPAAGIAGRVAGTDEADRLYKELAARTAARRQWANPENRRQTLPGAVAGFAATLPAQIAALPGQAPQIMKTMIDLGESVGTAQRAGLVATAANMAGVAAPVAIGRTIAQKMGTGAAMNVALGAGTDLHTQMIAQQEETKEVFDPLNPRHRAMEAVLGAGLGAMAKTPPKPAVPSILRNLDKPEITREQPQAEFADLALAEAKRRAEAAARPPEVIPVDSRGTAIVDQGLYDATRPLEVDTRYQGGAMGGILPPEIRRQLEAEMNPPRDPALLQLADELPPGDRGVRHPDPTTGRPVQGMAEDVPTIDFPLRQEVLDSPEIRRATDAFREEYAAAKTPEERAQIESRFMAGMRELGVYRPQDAQGLQRLWESVTRGDTPALRYPRGIKHTFQGKLQRLWESVTRRDTPALRYPRGIKHTFQGKQRGMIHPDLLGIGKVVDMIEKLGRLATLLKFRGAFTDNVMANAVRAARDAGGDTDIVLMRPVDFKRYVPELETHIWPEDYAQRRQDIRDGLHGQGLHGLPVLELQEGKIVGHDGRHRMDEFIHQGVDFVPVVIKHTRPDGAWKVKPSLKEWPTHVMNESGTEILEFPYRPVDVGRPKTKQTGAVFPKEITEGIKVLTDGIKDIWRQNYGVDKSHLEFRKLPGMVDVRYVSEDTPLTPELKQTILSEPDGSSVWFGTPGRVARQELANSTLVKTVGRYWENARNRAAVFIENNVEPMKREMNKMMRRPEDVKLVHGIFLKELQRGGRFSDDQLRAAGANDRVISVYKQMRDNFDRVLAKENEVLQRKGKKPISALDAYMSARWLGPWQARVSDEKGNLIYHIAERSLYGRTQAIRWLKQHEPKLKITEIKYDKTYARETKNLQAGYRDMIELLGANDPAVQRIDALMKQRAVGETLNILGQEQHFLRKGGIKGYAGERPWADPLKDAKAFLEQQIEYIENGVMWAEQQRALELTKQVVDDAEIQRAQENNVQYLREFSKMEMGMNSLDWVRGLEEDIAYITGISPEHMAQGLGITKSLFYLTKLGLSLPFMAISVAQPGLVLLPMHMAKKTDMRAALWGALMEGPAMAIRQLALEYGKTDLSKLPLRPLTEEALKYAMANRVTELNQLSDVRDVTLPRSIQLAERTVGATISMPELVARSITFASFVEGLAFKHNTKTHEGRLALFEEAMEMTKSTMGDYNPQHKAPIYQRLGLIGNAASTLQTFVVNQLYQAWNYGKMAKAGNPKPLIAYLTLMWAFAGATGMMGVDDAEDLLNNLKKIMPHDMYMRAKDWSIKGWMIENLGQVGAYGLASNLTGSNIYTRFSLGDMTGVPMFEGDTTTVLDNYAPFLVEAGRQIGALHTLMTPGTDFEKKQAGYTLTPAGLRGLYEEHMPGMKRGDLVMQPTDLTRGLVRRPPEEERMRELGFRGLREQAELDRGFSARTREREFDQRREGVRENFVQAMLDEHPDDMVKYFRRFIELEGNPVTLFRGLTRAQRNAHLTRIERELIKVRSTSPTQINKALRYVDLVKQLPEQ